MNLLEATGISKRFPGVQALDSASINVMPGEIIGLLGENGAGKSTLIKILAGILPKDEGTVIFNGQGVEINSPHRAQELGISIIYQELNLIPNLSIAENLFIGREKRKASFFLDRENTIKNARVLMEQVGLSIDPDVLVEELSISHRQMVEVAKALSLNARLYIMDEPTSTLTKSEVEVLFALIRRIKSENKSVIFVSHKMDEIFELCDRLHILRDGKDVATVHRSETNREEVVQMMVGREIGNLFKRDKTELGNEVLRVQNLCSDNGIQDVSFTVKKGEIVGIAGLVGSGRTETMRALFGIDRITAGRIKIEDQEVDIKNVEDAIALGLGLVPEDRKEQGLILEMTIRENISLPRLERFRRNGLLSLNREIQTAKDYIDKLNIRTPGHEQISAFLSGGNQQKVVLSKWLGLSPKILILDEPTRGIDVGAKKEIYAIMNELAHQGVAIIMISSELPEILAMSDRIVIMHDQTVKGILDRAGATQEKIMQIALTNVRHGKSNDEYLCISRK
jgi:ABC-type sugar transport system ATPase subunit